ncbi:tyrosine-type recombinase/integrase [Leclercia adecarboxylata]|uniref:tyrosine-type recombinase/integrase n=1 Tax=Leclercia adecarboxylata TaxID=83655 RepID=UPI002B31E7D6|nr:tyrosine-type recombinase/integrase [Leclercia adecarboxylata]WNY85612.1 tyrosine-type recombinase/integrase [Leclercia adecarboxylata]
MSQLIQSTYSEQFPVELSDTIDRLDLEAFSPGDLGDLIRRARLHGHRIEKHPRVRAAIEHNLEAFQFRAGRYSERTLESLTGAWSRYVSWCGQYDDRSPLPADVADVEAYLTERAGSVHRNTLSVDRWAIGRVSRAAGCPDPTADERLKDTFAALVRNKVRSDETIEQASALRELHLDQLVELWRESPLLVCRRDLALLVVAYETMLRASEVARIRCSHIRTGSDGTAILTIPITKTNHSGEPDKAPLSRQAMRLVLDYLAMCNRKLEGDHYLFGKATKHNKPAYISGPLSVDTVENIFARAWEVLGLETLGIPRWSGHSARVGASQDLAAEGYNTLEIMQAGRWTSERMVIRYCRDILAGESAMARRRAGKL